MAMASAIASKLARGVPRSADEDVVGGATYHFDYTDVVLSVDGCPAAGYQFGEGPPIAPADAVVEGMPLPNRTVCDDIMVIE